jgi:hypothetical protein
MTAASNFSRLDPKLQGLLPILQKMKASAMSGDEAEMTPGGVTYIVPDLDWRHDDLKSLMMTFDDLHLAGRFNPDGTPRRGKFPHHRIRDTARPAQAGHPPKGMPRNFYAPDWLRALDTWEYRRLDVQENMDLSLSPSLLRYVHRDECIIPGDLRCLSTSDTQLVSTT